MVIYKLRSIVGQYKGMYGRCPKKAESLVLKHTYPYLVEIPYFVDGKGNPTGEPFIGGQCHDLALHLGYRLINLGMVSRLQEFNQRINFLFFSGNGIRHFAKGTHIFLGFAYDYDLLNYGGINRAIIIDPAYQLICTFDDQLGYRIFNNHFTIFNPDRFSCPPLSTYLQISSSDKFFHTKLNFIPSDLPLDVFF